MNGHGLASQEFSGPEKYRKTRTDEARGVHMIEPQVSVKMITYNHERYIAQAIEGVLQQKTNFPFELVIGEDCSTDRTRTIVFEYQKKYPHIIRVITSEKNVGMKENGFRTLKACRGKYIAFCEGDDYWHNPLKLQKQVDYLEQHPECALVYSSYDMYYVRSQKRIKDYILYRNWKMPERPGIADFIEGKGGMSLGVLTCTTMVRRDVYDQVVQADPYLYENEQFRRGDTQLWAEISHAFPIHYIPESLATYNQTSESATRSRDVTKVIRLQIADAELGLYLCDKYNLPPSTRKEMEARRKNGFLRLAFHTENADLAAEIRAKIEKFTWKEWLLYSGAKYRAFHYPFSLGASIRDFIRKRLFQ